MASTTVTEKKEELYNVEYVETASSGNSDVGFTQKQTNSMIRKMDWRLLPFLSLLYLLSFLDRTNIGNARLAGLEESLHMNPKSLQYNNALAIFFPFYVFAEIPSNIMMKKTRPSFWIPTIMVAWAICTTLMGITKSYPGLMAARAALGLAEGGLFPGVAFYITLWYRRHECGLRLAIFYSAAGVAGAFGGLLARGINEMSGLGGLPGWAWIFILEGLFTFVVAICAYFIMSDYPETAKFLNNTERKEIHRRLEADRSSLADEADLKYFFHAIKDWKIWVHMFITIGIYCPLYSISLFLPTIIKNLGYTNNTAQLMTVPPYVVACFCTVTIGFLADKVKRRGFFMMGCTLVSMAGFIMLRVSSTPSIKYAGTYLVLMGVYPNVPQGVAWNGNNIGGSMKRGVGIAMHVGWGNLGGIVASYTFLGKDAPGFRTGHTILLGFLSMALLLQIFMFFYLRAENARRDRVSKPPSEYTEAERLAEREKGDNASFFRYTL